MQQQITEAVVEQPVKERKGPKCGVLMERATGRRCKNGAGQATNHVGYGACALHGGNSPNLQIAGLRAMAADAVATYGLPRNIDPHTALLEQVCASAGHVQWLALKIRTYEAEQLAWGTVTEELVRERVAQASAGENGGLEIVPESRDAMEKLVRRRIAMAAGASVWLKQYDAERDRLVHFCNVAIKCGVRERQVRIGEDIARQFSSAFISSLKDLGIDPYTEQARAVLRKNLLLAAAGGTAVIDVG